MFTPTTTRQTQELFIPTSEIESMFGRGANVRITYVPANNNYNVDDFGDSTFTNDLILVDLYNPLNLMPPPKSKSEILKNMAQTGLYNAKFIEEIGESLNCIDYFED